MCGGALSYADVVLAELADACKAAMGRQLADVGASSPAWAAWTIMLARWPALLALHRRVLALPPLAAYLASSGSA